MQNCNCLLQLWLDEVLLTPKCVHSCNLQVDHFQKTKTSTTVQAHSILPKHDRSFSNTNHTPTTNRFPLSSTMSSRGKGHRKNSTPKPNQQSSLSISPKSQSRHRRRRSSSNSNQPVLLFSVHFFYLHFSPSS